MTAAQVDSQYMKHLDERQKRLYAATLALKYGYGGIKKVHEKTGMDFNTIRAGIKDLRSEPLPGRVRQPGGGRKKAEDNQKKLIEAIDSEAYPNADKKLLVKHTTRSFAAIAQAVVTRGFQIGRTSVGRILKDLGYALKANKKEYEGSTHPDRNRQFRHLNMWGLKMQVQGFPILSIDAKKTEKVGNLKNAGTTWMPKGITTKVDVYDYGQKDPVTKKVIKAIPYGVYDVNKNRGFVNVGIGKHRRICGCISSYLVGDDRKE
jgi:transposase